MTQTWARFLSLAQSKLRLCSANHRAGYFSNLACDWLSIVWAYSELWWRTLMYQQRTDSITNAKRSQINNAYFKVNIMKSLWQSGMFRHIYYLCIYTYILCTKPSSRNVFTVPICLVMKLLLSSQGEFNHVDSGCPGLMSLPLIVAVWPAWNTPSKGNLLKFLLSWPRFLLFKLTWWFSCSCVWRVCNYLFYHLYGRGGGVQICDRNKCIQDNQNIYNTEQNEMKSCTFCINNISYRHIPSIYTKNRESSWY